jgi:hypothetical protein
VDAVEALERLGGTASAPALLALTSRKRLRTAVRNLRIRKAGRNRYVLPAADQARRAATLCGGYVTHLSAAMHWGWEVRQPPVLPQIGIPSGRALPRVGAATVRRLPRGTATSGLATAPLATVLLCAQDLPFADALCVADSALRHGDVDRDELLAAARTPRQRRVAEYADGRAANPFESSLRAIAIEEGLGVIPQFEVRARGLVLHPDLVDPIAGVVIEAESWEFHGKERAAFDADCERYTALVATGWRVLRFTWRQVMHDAPYVRACLRELYAGIAA